MTRVWVKSAKKRTNEVFNSVRGNETDVDLDNELAAMPRVAQKPRSSPLPDVTPEPTPERNDDHLDRPLKRNL